METYLQSLEQPKNVKYGTAGFRDNHTKLDYIVYAVGRLAALRSMQLQKAVGIMLTASHNPADDNGVKVVDPSGHMLETKWEQYATEMVNLDMSETITKIVKAENISISNRPTVIVGRDTRDSGTRLMNHIHNALKHANANIYDLNLVTTPQLHWATLYYNTHGTVENVEKKYYDVICNNFHLLTHDLNSKHVAVNVDGSNGIGAPKLALLLHLMQHYIPNYSIYQFNSDGVLNLNCGADFVKTKVLPPSNIKDTPVQHGELGASFDGDADRIVFYYIDDKFHLLDGDRIIALCAKGISQLLHMFDVKCSVGVVQTAYANGNSTNYLKSLGIPVSFTSTGVKHLHHKAEEYDVGIYFEANGHGTVLFSEELKQQAKSFPKLNALVQLINQTTGDAISDLFMVLYFLQQLNMTAKEWDGLYTDLPSILIKVVVKDRYLFKTTNAEQTLIAPDGLQSKIDLLCKDGGRSFVRPSGTEDVVRVYAEHQTVLKCEQLGYAVAGMIFDAYGIGSKPKEFK